MRRASSSGNQHPILVDTTLQGRPDQEASCQGEVGDHPHDKRERPGRANFSQPGGHHLALAAGGSIQQ